VRIVFLGTAGSLPTPKRNVCAVAVQVGSEIILFDCGEGTQRQFMRSTASYMKVHAVFVTHLHGDHFLGIPALIQSMSFSGREKDLFIYGPEGTIETVRSMLGLGYFAPGFGIAAADMQDGSEVCFRGFKVRAVRSEHTVPSLAYVLEEDVRPGRFDVQKARALGVRPGPAYSRLQEGHAVEVGGKTITPEMVLGPNRRGRKVVVTGDTRPAASVAEAARGADVLVHEATVTSDLIQDANEYGHSTAAGAAQIALQAGVKKLYMYHFSSRYDDPGPLVAEARAIFAESYAADDFMVVQVNAPDSL